jgi:hypothetical protein
MKVAVMENYDEALYISCTRQPAKPIPRNAQVWKAIGWVTKEKVQKMYPGDVKDRWSYCISVRDIARQFVCHRISAIVCE